jgi:hypothetical protein
MSGYLPTTLAALAHRAEGQCLLEGQTLNVASMNTKTDTFQERSAVFKVAKDLRKSASMWRLRLREECRHNLTTAKV